MTDEEFYNSNIDAIHDVNACIENDDPQTLKSMLIRNPDLLNHNVYLVGADALLAYAALEGRFAICEVLLDLDAPLDRFDEASSALTLAAANGHMNVVKLLVKNGALIDAAPKSVTTPLMSAISGSHVEVAKFLIEQGADINRFHLRLYQTPLDLAMVWKQNEIESIIRSMGGISVLRPDWSTHGDSEMLDWMGSNFGGILALDCLTSGADTSVSLGLSLANKGKNKILFSVGIIRFTPSAFEICMVLDGNWNPYDKTERNQFPVYFMYRLIEACQRSETIDEGACVDVSDARVSDLVWPSKIDRACLESCSIGSATQFIDMRRGVPRRICVLHPTGKLSKVSTASFNVDRRLPFSKLVWPLN